MRTICEAMNTQSVYKSMLFEVHNNILRLYLTVPVTSATSERSFLALRRVLTYLHSSMTEERLNSCIVLHIHKHLTGSCDLMEIAKELLLLMMNEGSILELSQTLNYEQVLKISLFHFYFM